MRDRRGSGLALLNVPVFMRAVKSSYVEWLAGLSTHTLRTTFSQRFTCRKPCHWIGALSVHLSKPLFVSVCIDPNQFYTAQIFHLYNCSKVVFFMVNDGFFLPVQEFPHGWVRGG